MLRTMQEAGTQNNYCSDVRTSKILGHLGLITCTRDPCARKEWLIKYVWVKPIYIWGKSPPCGWISSFTWTKLDASCTNFPPVDARWWKRPLSDLKMNERLIKPSHASANFENLLKIRPVASEITWREFGSLKMKTNIDRTYSPLGRHVERAKWRHISKPWCRWIASKFCVQNWNICSAVFGIRIALTRSFRKKCNFTFK